MSKFDELADKAVVDLADSVIARRAIAAIVHQLRELPEHERTPETAKAIYQRVVIGEVAAFGERLHAQINEMSEKLNAVIAKEQESSCSPT